MSATRAAAWGPEATPLLLGLLTEHLLSTCTHSHASAGSDRSGKGSLYRRPRTGWGASGRQELQSQAVIPQPSWAPQDSEEKPRAPSRGRPAAVRWPAAPGGLLPSHQCPDHPAAHFLSAQLCSAATGKPLGAIGLSVTHGRSQRKYLPVSCVFVFCPM